jgi:molybdenum cofactor cytidylyltransferase
MAEVETIARVHHADIAVNPAPGLGMFSSVQAGLKALFREEKAYAAALIFPVDHPRVSEQTIRAMISAFSLKPERSWIQPVYEKQRGHPILIDAGTARALLDLPPECTLRDALVRCGLTPCEVPVSDPGILKNVNRPEDLS